VGLKQQPPAVRAHPVGLTPVPAVRAHPVGLTPVPAAWAHPVVLAASPGSVTDPSQDLSARTPLLIALAQLM